MAMTGNLLLLGDIGATNRRVAVYDQSGEFIAGVTGGTNPDQYAETIQGVADTAQLLARGAGGNIVAASVAVAAEVDNSGVLTRSGGLSPWIGNNPGRDIGDALDLPSGRVNTPNDVEAIALSQQQVNRENGRSIQGVAMTLSSGWGGALYEESGRPKPDEPGHEFLREGATCPCGQEGHAEAYVSGNGVKLNHGIDMKEWLKAPEARRQLITDLSTAVIDMINRVENLDDFDFQAEELRWTGGVALGQPFLMRRVAEVVRDEVPSIAFDTVTMGEQAGLHGTFVDARRRAEEY